jgi:hypothetical protein
MWVPSRLPDAQALASWALLVADGPRRFLRARVQEPLSKMLVPRVVFWRQKLGRGGDNVTGCEFAELLDMPSV